MVHAGIHVEGQGLSLSCKVFFNITEISLGLPLRIIQKQADMILNRVCTADNVRFVFKSLAVTILPPFFLIYDFFCLLFR